MPALPLLVAPAVLLPLALLMPQASAVTLLIYYRANDMGVCIDIDGPMPHLNPTACERATGSDANACDDI